LPTTQNDCFAFGQRTFARPYGNDADAPIADPCQLGTAPFSTVVSRPKGVISTRGPFRLPIADYVIAQIERNRAFREERYCRVRLKSDA
jgi:hypothetical protein